MFSLVRRSVVAVMVPVTAVAIGAACGPVASGSVGAGFALEVGCAPVVYVADHSVAWPCDPDGSQSVVVVASDQATCDLWGGRFDGASCHDVDY